jgi:hypothetical protein
LRARVASAPRCTSRETEGQFLGYAPARVHDASLVGPKAIFSPRPTTLRIAPGTYTGLGELHARERGRGAIRRGDHGDGHPDAR